MNGETAIIRRSIPLLLAAAALAGCDNPLGAGPCVHTYDDPVLEIDAARSTADAAIDAVILSELALDGRAVTPAELLGAAPDSGVEALDDGRIRCDVPCGFGYAEGSYAFTAAAEGYQPGALTVEARYDDFSGGCPSSSAGGTTVSVELSPEP
jgi:hypothetical protein